ncbi:MAG: hydrogenase maturation protease [Infirmifilum sp.]
MNDECRGHKELEELLETLKGLRVVFVGIGNPLSGDDGVGFYVARKLIKKGFGEYVVVAGPNPELHIRKIKEKKPDVLILIDAVDMGLKPGCILVAPVPGSEFKPVPISTHSIPLAILVDMLQVKTYLIGIQVEKIEFGAEMSRSVREAGDTITEIITSMLSDRDVA